MTVQSKVTVGLVGLSLCCYAPPTSVRGGSQTNVPAPKKSLTKDWLVPVSLQKMTGAHAAKDVQGGFPFQVALVVDNFQPENPETGFFCSGSWIDRQWVLTAAHCLEAHGERFVVFSNSESVNSAKQHPLRAETFCVPDNFGPGNRLDVNDVGLIKFTSEAPAPATVARSTDEKGIPEGTPASISVRTDKASSPFIVQQVTMMGIDACSTVEGLAGSITTGMLCAHEQQFPCQGDSGGPLVEMVDNNLKLVGIVSAGGGCAQVPPVPIVFTQVAHFAKWIDPIIAGKKECKQPKQLNQSQAKKDAAEN